MGNIGLAATAVRPQPADWPRKWLAICAAFALGVTLPALARANTITVNTLADPGLASQCSLRSAILASVKTRVIDGCPAGSGADTVVFDNLTGTITLANTLGVTGNNGVLTIAGPAGGITISGNDQVRIVNLSAGMILNLQNLTLTRGKASLGAAIFNQGGMLTVSDCVFSKRTRERRWETSI